MLCYLAKQDLTHPGELIPFLQDIGHGESSFVIIGDCYVSTPCLRLLFHFEFRDDDGDAHPEHSQFTATKKFLCHDEIRLNSPFALTSCNYVKRLYLFRCRIETAYS
jgi:hypothetical protein